VGASRSFDARVDEAERAPIDGWDFSWLDGRATEERPSWGYSQRVAERAARAQRMLDLQSGGGEMLGALPHLPPLMVATEGYAPNVLVAAGRLQPRGAYVIATEPDRPVLPIAANAFDLVTSRHPVDTWWDEIARVLRPGGTYFSQQVGPSSNRELSEALMGPLPPGSGREPAVARAAAEEVGLVVEDLRSERLRVAFFDIGAVVYFLRLVVWTVPDFTVDRYRAQLREVHDRIERDGAFVSHSTRFLIEVTKPR
jgi:SAM-dependent methyltransferase